MSELEQAINYAKVRNVKTFLTLNILIKNNEIKEALALASKAYELGIDALIAQDLGLAKILIDNFPDLPIHASTQMTVHNLDGVLALQNLGFKRVVLARELSIKEIEHICKNSNVEIEVFIHGALCISYSGRCLISSVIGGRSGNRGKCAQACRLPYKLLQDNKIIDNGYLLSARDICSLDYIKKLIEIGVDSFKIEGRMKSPEYVSIVTNTYRHYIDNATTNIDNQDLKNLAQTFNRGGFSHGHLSNEPSNKLVYPIKPNNTGIFIGTVSQFNPKKSYITTTPKEEISIGDTLIIGKDENKYTISEIVLNNKNLKSCINQKVEIGRIKGKINIGDSIYRIHSKNLSNIAQNSYSKEFIKVPINGEITVKKNRNIKVKISLVNNPNIYIYKETNIITEQAITNPFTKERLIKQFSKTGNTPFEFSYLDIDMDNDIYISNISLINELRRSLLNDLENLIINNSKRKHKDIKLNTIKTDNINDDKQISLLLNILNKNYDYTKLSTVNHIYIPFRYYLMKEYQEIIKTFKSTYIYFPSIIKDKYHNLITKNLDNILNLFNIDGFVISNLSDLQFTKKYNKKIVSNYTFNVYNNYTKSILENLGINKITISPELNKSDLNTITCSNSEFIVYGNLPVMVLNYCPLGKSNKCYNKCSRYCLKNSHFYLKDRMGLNFRIIPDNIETITTVYNSKITSISTDDTPFKSYRIDILDENIDEINNIIQNVKNGNKLTGNLYTNGNLNKNV